MKTYTLASSNFVHTPGFICWAINGCKFPKDRKRLIKMISDGWSIPSPAARALLLEEVPFTVVDGDAVRFTAPATGG
jgi:hypothetical protein